MYNKKYDKTRNIYKELNMTVHSYILTRASGITFLVVPSLVNELRKIRDLRCYTDMITKKFVREQSRKRIKGKGPGRNQRCDNAQLIM